jgi:hypothetical protein
VNRYCPACPAHLTAGARPCVAAPLAGPSGTPAQIAGFGQIGGSAALDLIEAASRNPPTRWCITEVDPATGEAVSHGCARGPHLWTRPPNTGPPRTTLSTGPPGAGVTGFLRSLKIRLTPIAKTADDPQMAEDHHDPSRHLRHLISARNATCAAPGCTATAVKGDMEHRVPWEKNGPTSEGNLDPTCDHAHIVKQ